MKIGIDICQNNRFKHPLRQAQKILSSAEIQQLQQQKSLQRRQTFIAGRWAVKEAIFKATNYQIPFPQMDIFFCSQTHQLKINNKYFADNKITISLAHEKKFSVAICIFNA